MNPPGFPATAKPRAVSSATLVYDSIALSDSVPYVMFKILPMKALAIRQVQRNLGLRTTLTVRHDV